MPHLHLYNNVLMLTLPDELYNIIANDCGGIKMCVYTSTKAAWSCIPFCLIQCSKSLWQLVVLYGNSYIIVGG